MEILINIMDADFIITFNVYANIPGCRGLHRNIANVRLTSCLNCGTAGTGRCKALALV